MTSTRQIPASPEAERAVLGSMLIDPGAVREVRKVISPGDFYQEKHGWICAAIFDLHDKRIAPDFVTVTDELEQRGQLKDAGGIAYVMDLINEVPSSVYADHYAGIVLRLSEDRRAIELAGRIATEAYRGKGTALGLARDLMRNAKSGSTLTGNMRSMTQVTHDMLDMANEYKMRRAKDVAYDVLTGINQIDKYLLGGLYPGDVFVIAGQTGSRKSVIAQMAAHYASIICGHGGLVFSTEMPGEQLAARALGAHIGVSSRLVQRGLMSNDQWEQAIRGASEVSCDHLLVEDLVMSSQFIAERVDEAEEVLAKRGKTLRYVVLDYLQMVRDPRSYDRRIDIDALLWEIKRLSKRVPFIVVSSIRRTENLNVRPSIRDALESSFIEFTATHGAVTWRDTGGVYRIEFQKVRDGPTGEETLPAGLPNQAWFDVQFQKPRG